MMNWTDRHCRAFHRLLCPRAVLYTEMVTSAALLHGSKDRLLAFNVLERPVVLQLGGCVPQDLARCAQMAQVAGYDEVNLNLGCPSKRVQKGTFGASLMRQPARVAECVAAMREAVNIPVSVKCRIGVDEEESYVFLAHFIETLAAVGVEHFIIHARKAMLKGLNPAQNRNIPPLHYERVHAIKSDFPQLRITANGGITSVDQLQQQLERVDGVMLGRAAYKNPWLIAGVSQALFGTPLPATRATVLSAYQPYVQQQLNQGVALHSITRHLHGLFNGLPGARRYRRHLSDHDLVAGAGMEVLWQAAAQVREETPWAHCCKA